MGLSAVQVLVVHVVSLTANKFSFAVLVTSALAASVDISSPASILNSKCYHQDLIIEHVVDLWT